MNKAVSKSKFIRELVRKYLSVRQQKKTGKLHVLDGYPSIGVFEEDLAIGAQHLMIFYPTPLDCLIMDQHFHRSQRGTEELLKVATEIAQVATRKISAKTREPAYIGLPSPRRFAPWFVQRSGEAENQ